MRMKRQKIDDGGQRRSRSMILETVVEDDESRATRESSMRPAVSGLAMRQSRDYVRLVKDLSFHGVGDA